MRDSPVAVASDRAAAEGHAEVENKALAELARDGGELSDGHLLVCCQVNTDLISYLCNGAIGKSAK